MFKEELIVQKHKNKLSSEGLPEQFEVVELLLYRPICIV
jgi:hypothetical protein